MLFGLGLSGVRPALARRGDPADGSRPAMLRQAQPLLDKGAAALSARDFAAAAKALGSAYRSAPLPEVLLQLARLAQAEGRTTDAYDLYRRYLADPTRIPERTAAQEAETVLATPPPGSGSLAVSGPPSAIVLLDGRVVGVLPLPQPLLLTAGEHSLLLEVGSKRLDTPLQVQEGRLTEVRAARSSGALLIRILPALLVFDEWSGVPAESVRPFSEAIERAAILQQFGTMPTAAALRQASELRACIDTASCQQKLAKRSGLDYVLRSRTTRVALPAPAQSPQPAPAGAAAAATIARWTFELTLLHVEISEPASQATLTCEACTTDQAAARYRDALAELLTRGLPRQLGTATITSEPPAAAVTLAQRPAGQTPLNLTLWEGNYDLTLQLPRRKPATAALTITAGGETPLRVQLEPEDQAAAVPVAATPGARGSRRPPRWRLALGGTLVSVGALILTAGALNFVIDGQCVPLQPSDTSPQAASCRVLFDTRTAGIASVSVGLAFGVAGTVMLAIPGPRQPAGP